jgi:hypothetical protein
MRVTYASDKLEKKFGRLECFLDILFGINIRKSWTYSDMNESSVVQKIGHIIPGKSD